MADVPPELRPYYERPTLGARLRRAALFVLPLLVVLILVAGAAWGLVWLNRHKPATSNPTSKGQTSRQTTPTNNQPSSNGSSQQGNQNQSSSNNQSSNQGSQPATQSQPPSQGTGGAQPTPGTGGSSSNTGGNSPSSIPNTGPDAGILTLSVAASAAGAAVFHVRQMRRAKQNG